MNTSGTVKLIAIVAGKVAPSDVIGAKAHSLQQLTALGLRVPPACVLPTGFFHPWFALLQRLPSWTAWLAGQREQWPALCAAIKADALELPIADVQRLVLDDLSARLASHGPMQRFAVRSSAPDEDTASASFAGLYETELGVAAAGLEAAIRRCFAACLDYRVFAYKAAQGMSLDQLSMALIVQEQIDSDVAGVGFSINPLTNDFDEAAIDANWGLGESVVSGMVSPDPGWTPLFINAAAVILEVGGVLQHGAVVAREYGKPCVAGIADVLTCFADGQLVEVDGTAGIVRIILELPTE